MGILLIIIIGINVSLKRVKWDVEAYFQVILAHRADSDTDDWRREGKTCHTHEHSYEIIGCSYCQCYCYKFTVHNYRTYLSKSG